MARNGRRIIEDFLPIKAIHREHTSASGHINTLHIWWARRPLLACRAAVYSALVPAARFVPNGASDDKKKSLGRANAAKFIERLCKYPGDPKVIAEAQRHILEAHADGYFGYASGPKPAPGPDGKFQVTLSKVRFKAPVTDDEIDLESGFLMLPQAIPPASATGTEPINVVPGQETQPAAGGTGTAVPPGITIPGQPVTPKSAADKHVELTITADRNALYTAWNAIANLADMAGQVQVTIRAESEKGFDKSKLQNGVLEPLREADLIE
jgi:hypothetical protein